MRGVASIAAAISLAVAATPVAAGGGGTAGAAASPCSANSEVTPKGKIAFGFRCPGSPVSEVVIDAISPVRKVKPRLLVDPGESSRKAPKCVVLTKPWDGPTLMGQPGDVRCRADVAPDAVVTGWLAVAGDPCNSSLTFLLAGGGSSSTLRTGVPQSC